MISSLQDLIAQFKGNFHLSSGASKSVNSKSKPAPDTTGKGTAASTGKGASLSHQDKLTLSTEAKAYQKAHTLPSGKFLSPNVFGDFMDVLDSNNKQNSDTNTDSPDKNAPSSLLDFLNADSKKQDSSLQDMISKLKPDSKEKLNGIVNPINNKPFNSLTDFL